MFGLVESFFMLCYVVILLLMEEIKMKLCKKSKFNLFNLTVNCFLSRWNMGKEKFQSKVTCYENACEKS